MLPRGDDPGNADLTLRLRGGYEPADNPSRSDRYTYAGPRKILLVHGYATPETKGLRLMRALHQALTRGCDRLGPQIFTTTWPGDYPWYLGGKAAYFVKVPVAAASGKALWAHLATAYAHDDGPEELVLIAHSLGCRLVLECLNAMPSREGRPAQLKKVVAILMAAAVPTDDAALLDGARAKADAIDVLHSTDDWVLWGMFRLGQTAALDGFFPEAIGYRGHPVDPAWTFARPMEAYGHGDYWTGAATADVIGGRLTAHFPDEILYNPGLAAEHALPQRNRLREIGDLAIRTLDIF